ncbi:hypothetical protein J2Z62_000146 [Mycoplasmoides fastidiosum]|uniref:Transposase n=1 Tax=Mycoplasmoides fastidiosum TaxID=92758 RepID=A0ABU0LYE3_9BACT|nr:hypothetical protein [Mycoplasmoides fastidiosum]MDQ0513708.1 hypothetical protein [Mycoplasmoides fastidiosum]UUD37869.1 hypothetical protein NPA10_00530 [Mycoplasmoides fastidiosum]
MNKIFKSKKNSSKSDPESNILDPSIEEWNQLFPKFDAKYRQFCENQKFNLDLDQAQKNAAALSLNRWNRMVPIISFYIKKQKRMTWNQVIRELNVQGFRSTFYRTIHHVIEAMMNLKAYDLNLLMNQLTTPKVIRPKTLMVRKNGRIYRKS